MTRAVDVALVCSLVVCSLVGGCQSGGGLPEVKGGIELGLRRGSAWSTLTVRPPYVIGPRVNLQLKRDAFVGAIEGRPVQLTIEQGEITGTGPMGQVNLSITEGPDELIVEGMWNGARVHFRITSHAMRGSIAVYQSQSFENVLFCQYVLDKVERNGSRSGMSICGGLPEDTLIEVPRAVQGWLTRPELVVVLMALLSSPPFTNMETSL